MESSERTFSAGPQSDTSNGTTTVNESSRQESQTDSFPQPQSLATCVSSYGPVRLQSIEDLRTWLRQGSRASHSAPPGTCSAQMIREICGRQRQMSFATFDPASSCWKTSQVSLLADMQQSSSVDWPQWGMWADGAAYQLPSLVPHTYAFDGGSLPTLRANDAEKRGNIANDKRNGLAASARYMPTPTATDWKRSRMKASYANRPQTIGAPDDLAKFCVRNAGMEHARLDAELWEWMMGWPIMWARLRPLETAKYLQWLRQHGGY